MRKERFSLAETPLEQFLSEDVYITTQIHQQI